MIASRLLAFVDPGDDRMPAARREPGRRSIAGMTDATEPAEPTLDGLDLSDEERIVLARVAEVLRRINFGTVVLVVQDGKVVQIEMAEKFRLR
jgi:hypothetical protein